MPLNAAAGTSRRTAAFERRVEAAQLARDRVHPRHYANGDEARYRAADGATPTYLASYTKGLTHDRATGLVRDDEDFDDFVKAIDSADPDAFARLDLGPAVEGDWLSTIAKGDEGSPYDEPVDVRAWESAGAGSTFDLQGPDAQAVTMPPCPRLGSAELRFEMAELYLMALVRDVPFGAWEDRAMLQAAADRLGAMGWTMDGSLARTPAEMFRRRGLIGVGNVFRGFAPGVEDGPYISQYLLRGSSGIGKSGVEAGEVMYGAQGLDMKVRSIREGKDWMTTWEAYIDVQDGADLRGAEAEAGDYGADGVEFRFIATPRDLATYVHYDALYQAYLNAAFSMLADGVPFDPGFPFEKADNVDKQQGFATFGGPHILSLVCEVATRALKVVRFQKFNVHRRLRPEAVGGLIHVHKSFAAKEDEEPAEPVYNGRCKRRNRRCRRRNHAVAPPPAPQDVGKDLGRDVAKLCKSLAEILTQVADHNAAQNREFEDRATDASAVAGQTSYLLPMAFPEGSPMHPSYGAGHGTVAGACVTILKAFFDSNATIDRVFQATADGASLEEVAMPAGERLTVGGELNKLAANVAIGRGFAGVHYSSDNVESLLVGEEVAIGLLEEQKLTYGESFSMTLTKFDGTSVRI